MSALVEQSLSIPKEIRPDVAAVVARTRRTVNFSRPDLDYLFTVYNRFIAPSDEPEDANCAGCRAAVVGKLRKMVDGWQEQEMV